MPLTCRVRLAAEVASCNQVTSERHRPLAVTMRMAWTSANLPSGFHRARPDQQSQGSQHPVGLVVPITDMMRVRQRCIWT
mmetsp:Transcript_89347/g.288918  ORF Transcript_89347/g.288918 Transcript_89347/m.288918 type:complete len:80 (-) Transcript_89347:2101-2340(-)